MNKSEEFAATLPVGPLVQHLTQLHALLSLRVLGDAAIEVGEHSLRQIAVYSQENTYYPSTTRDERALGWERAHTTLCPNTNCREHRNPWQRSRA